MLKKILSFCLILSPFLSSAQKQTTFTHADTLRGAITPQRAWWDLTYYHLNVTPNAKDSTLSGSTVINYKVLEPKQIIQIDLQEPLQIEKVIQEGQTLTYKRDGNAFFITLAKKQEKGKSESIEVFYSGRPRLAKRPPWDGGVQWVPDGKGNTIISTSCQGLGSSVWCHVRIICMTSQTV